MHEVGLTADALRTLTCRYGDDITVHGPASPVGGRCRLFEFKGIHPHDLSQCLISPVCGGWASLRQFLDATASVSATARASFYVYDEADVYVLADALDDAARLFT